MVDAVTMTTRKERRVEGSGTRECSRDEGMKRRMVGEMLKRKKASEREELDAVLFTAGAEKIQGYFQKTIKLHLIYFQ